MTFRFDDTVVRGVLGHMNADHTGDNLLIARAYGAADDYTAAVMTGFDGDGGDWLATRGDGTTDVVRVPWPGGPIEERPHVRREIVALYDEACARLGVPPRPHS
ncbi:DUF2470 domain-containing protein [Microbacterium sp. 4R-513]|uniref:DUF2470 domain-containing protein n=1 Tax=Microbacterium sp. 4R-513 TaxID=2567934 RepID=UPI0013E0EE49|nr:DUF2470 domain-containing protein [Microbacterium sp. 4R-513]QIG39040.1 DUF2470 domain-containing protein [Microbacterium sp. 4R-513]